MTDFDLRVLAFFAKHDIHGDVWWKVKDGAATWLVSRNLTYEKQ